MADSQVNFNTFGNPSDVLEVGELQKVTALAKGQIRVGVKYAPINPADINYIQGVYGVKPELPAVPGLEASGVVLESNSDQISEGDAVIFIERVGTWKNEVICGADSVYVFPEDLDICQQQASMLKVNPLTALRLLKDFVVLKPGDYVIQNAANSGVGQCLIQIAKQLGLKTINVVRRVEVMDELKALGADHVLLDNDETVAEVREICGEHLPKLACNAVGGDSALRLMDAIAQKGAHVTYGAMSLRSLKVPNKFLIFKRIHIQGLWVTEWIKDSSQEEINAAYTQLAQWISAGKLKQSIDTVYPISEVNKAADHAMQGMRNGKILLQL